MAVSSIVLAAKKPAPDRFAYYPGTEMLVKDEGVIACGTGLPD